MKLFEGVIAMLNSIIHGDCLEVLMTLEDNSIDSIVTDPPYELGFMGKSWDSTGIAYNVELWKECLRVLKPGGHLLAFGGTRTYHRMTCAIEDAGFEIRDCIQWLYGSGFPKSHDISKAIDKKLGAKDEAQEWEGWGTALKPANEPIVLARKPLSEKTIAENVMKWGTGGLNIDGTRMPTNEKLGRNNKARNDGTSYIIQRKDKYIDNSTGKGRFPANVILDEEAGRMLDEQSGITKSGGTTTKGAKNNWGNPRTPLNNIPPSVGGASRFFYCAKASKKERGEFNKHPTVKPITLMEYLIKLVTPPEGIVLDPFIGSGTTAIASLNTGRSFIGIELNEGYVEIARGRVASHTAQQELKFA